MRGEGGCYEQWEGLGGRRRGYTIKEKEASGGESSGGGGEKISDVVEMLQLPIWFFRHLFVVMGHFVLSSAGSAAPPHNGAYYQLRLLPLFDSPEHARPL